MKKITLFLLLLSWSIVGYAESTTLHTTNDGCKFFVYETQNAPFKSIDVNSAKCINGYLEGKVTVTFSAPAAWLPDTAGKKISGNMINGTLEGQVVVVVFEQNGTLHTPNTYVYKNGCGEKVGCVAPIRSETNTVGHNENSSNDNSNSSTSDQTKSTHKKDSSDASHCIKIDAENSQFRNTCDFKVSVGYCTLYPRGTTNDIYSQYSCRRLGAEQAEWDNQLVIDAHGSAMYENDGRDADGVYHVACESPNRPLGITYSSARKPVLQAKDCRYD